MTKKRPPTIVHGGRFYTETEDGRIVEVPAGEAEPEWWICRRVDDYPGRCVPKGGALGICVRCGRVVNYSPSSPIPPSTPKICQHCAGIRPEPMIQ